MAMFVHLTSESRVRRICRNGIRMSRRKLPGSGVFAVPVTRNFYASHQWLRELKRANPGPLAAIYFRIPDEQQVWVGHYGQAHRKLTAAQAIAHFAAAPDPMGWEVIIPHRIEPKAIHRTKKIPQVIGWRYYPTAKGKPPFCTCDYCLRGQYGAQRIRQRLATPVDPPSPRKPRARREGGTQDWNI